MKRLLLATAMAAVSTASFADTMTTVSLSENGGPASVFSNIPSTGLFGFGFGAWSVYARESGGPGSAGFEVNLLNSAPSSLWVVMTTQGLTQPTGVAQFMTEFRLNATLPVGWSMSEQVWMDPNNGVGFTGSPVTNVITFTGGAPQSIDVSKLLDYGAGPYSLTALFNVSGVTANGQANSDINVGAGPVAPPSEVPVPAAAWLFGSGLVGLATLLRRRKKP